VRHSLACSAGKERSNAQVKDQLVRIATSTKERACTTTALRERGLSFGMCLVIGAQTNCSRPSNARIAELEEENRRLQASLTHISPDDQSESFDHATKHSGGSQMMSPDSQSMSYARSMSDVPTQSPDAGDDNASSSVHTLGVRNRNETAASDPTGYLPEEDEPRYYGPTSALHNDASRFGRLQPSITRPNVPVELVQKGLIAEAAQQRKLPSTARMRCMPLIPIICRPSRDN